MNWENFEIIALIHAKKYEYEANLEVVDLRNNMETSIKKWKHILNNGRIEHHLNIPTYKDKWGFLYGDCKKKKTQLQKWTRHNEEYWDMFVEGEITQGLPKNIRKMLFEFINSFMNNKPCFNPPHMQDFMNPNDNVYYALTNHASSPCDDHEIIEMFNNEEADEKDASYLFATQDVIFHHA